MVGETTALEELRDRFRLLAEEAKKDRDYFGADTLLYHTCLSQQFVYEHCAKMVEDVMNDD